MSFSIHYSQLNHHKRDSQITRRKISHNLIEPQTFPCTPAYIYQFHVLAFHPPRKLTAPLVGSVFGICSEVCGGAFLRRLFRVNSQRVLLTVFAEELRC